MDPSDRRERCREIMETFARSTGVTSDEAPRRYLWTDAFAVCNQLGLYEAGGDRGDLEVALALVDQVHRMLGRHRPDDRRRGWISGLSEEEGARHPTAGGLRIGKPEPERGPDEPYDPHGEWNRDGQYYHYLTRWMHALHRVWRVTEEDRYGRWARELAKAAHAAFVVPADASGGPRMHWKMSIDLSRPLVPTMGAHDPLDGLVTFNVLAAGRHTGTSDASAGQPSGTPEAAARPSGTLDAELAALADMCHGARWATEDPLGIGGLLVDTYRVAELLSAGARPVTPGRMPAGEWLASLLDDCAASLSAYRRTASLESGAGSRLAFRELGLAIGLAGVRRLRSAVERARRAPGARAEAGRSLSARLERLAPALDLEERILRFWLDPSHHGPTWTDHLDINRVMLATALASAGYLEI